MKKVRLIKVVIIELDFHADNLTELIEMFLLKFDPPFLAIDLILKRDIFEIVKSALKNYTNVNALVYENNISHYKCLSLSKNIISLSDVVFINTIAKSLKAFTILQHDNIILRVHNSNKQFAPFRHLDWSFDWENLKLLTKFFIKEVLFNDYFRSLKKINRQVKLFAFSDFEMVDYAIKRYKEIDEQNSIYIPLKYYRVERNAVNQNIKSFINISVIGRIDDETRNIEVLRDCFKEIANNDLQREVIITFIGTGNKKPMQRLKMMLSELSNKMMRFKYIYENVSQETIIDFINKSDLIISPLKVKCKVGVFLETYGKTKISGNFSDIAISPQPVFLPAAYLENWPSETELSAAYLNGKDLAQKVVKCINDSEYLTLLNDKAKEEAERRYGKEIILEQLSKITING